MKKTFKIINTFMVVLTVLLVSMNFITKFSTGNKIYKQVYEFSNNVQMDILVNDLSKSGEATEDISSSVLSSSQKRFIPILVDSLKSLNDYFTFLSTRLSQEKSKSNKINQIKVDLYTLEDKHSDLVLDLEEYLTKLSGNTIGSIETSVDYIFSQTIDYLYDYSSLAIKINNIITYKETNIVEYNLINLHLKSILLLKEDYEDLAFKNDYISLVETMNIKLQLNHNNFVLGEYGIYSPTASLFNQYIEQANINDLLTNYSKLSITPINPKTEKDNTKLAFYYFNILTEVV